MTSFDSDSDEENEIRRCIYYCYYMDKTLSMLLLRPPSLPQLLFNPADLVPTDPQLPISMHVKILVKLARVQDVALSLVLKDPRHQILANKEFMLENIQTELKSIGDEIQQVIKFPFTPLMEYTEIPLVAVSATPRTLNYDRMGYS
jgi:hypothetical protein